MSDFRCVRGDLTSLVRLREPLLQQMELAEPWGVSIEGCRHPGMYAVRGGALAFGSGGGRARLERGDLVLLPSGGPHVLRDGRGSRPVALETFERRLEWRAGVAVSRGSGARSRFSSIPFVGSPAIPWLPRLVVVRGRDLGPLARSLVRAYDQALDDGDRPVLARVAEALWVHLLAERIPRLALLDHDVLGAASRVIERPEQPHRVQELARLAGLSRSRFTDRFRAAFGEPPRRWIHRVRMDHAARLLGEGLSFPAVAERLAFADEASFRKAYRRGR